jgi:outer membrane immunogenic protein
MKNLLLASAAFFSLTAAASAADLAPYTKAPAPIANPAVNWSGFYIGAMGGYSWSDSVRLSAGGVTATGSTSDINGGFGGGTIGYNWQMTDWVFGLEADAAGAGVSDSDNSLGVTLTEKVDAFGSATGRIGYVAGAALVYAKGGYAWADNKVSASAGGVGFSESHLHSGWTVGGGLEYMFAPNWSGKVEYMYADYEKQNYLSSFIPGGLGVGAAFHSIKVGVNYHFGGPVLAKY